MPPEPSLEIPASGEGADAAARYRPPELLRDLRLLDVLELTGTTELAGRWLAVSQPTVSRRYRRLAKDFGLTPERRGAKRCRFGATVSLRQLRLGARWHRFEAGVVGLATDPLHHGLLHGLEGLLPMPQRFRSGESWLELVREAVIDAALVSSLELEPPRTGRDPASANPTPLPGSGRQPAPREPERLHLGHWPLTLAAATAETALAGLHPLPQRTPLREHLWLLLPPDWPAVPVLRRTVQSLRRLAIEAGAEPHP